MRLLDRFRHWFAPPDVDTAQSTDELLRRVRDIEIKARRLVDDRFLGEYLAVFRGRGIEFDELRPYYPGDDTRDIDWKAFARSGEASIRRYREDRQLTMLFAVDISASQRAGALPVTKMDLAAEFCATLALAAVRNNDRVGMLLFASKPERYVRPASGATHVLRVVREVLSARATTPGTGIGGALEYLTSVHRRRATLFLVSDFLATGYEPELRAATRYHDIIAVCIREPLDTALPDAGLVSVTDAETGHTVDIDAGSPAVREEYAARIAAMDEDRRRLFGELGIDHLELQVGDDFVAPLLRLFHRRATRAA